MSKCPMCLNDFDTTAEYYAHLEASHSYRCQLVVPHTWHVARLFGYGGVLAVLVWVALSIR